jgi:hypothetical protein
MPTGRRPLDGPTTTTLPAADLPAATRPSARRALRWLPIAQAALQLVQECLIAFAISDACSFE